MLIFVCLSGENLFRAHNHHILAIVSLIGLSQVCVCHGSLEGLSLMEHKILRLVISAGDFFSSLIKSGDRQVHKFRVGFSH